MSLLGIVSGMGVADIGAGSGYYAVRLSPRVGPAGRVYAEDIMPAYVRDLRQRIQTDSLNARSPGTGGTTLSNIDVILGTADDPRLPVASVDRALLVHMYHEIEQPYEFLWNLRPSLKPEGLVIVVDADRETQNHGTPPALLDCELRAVGYVRAQFQPMPSAGGYFAAYRAQGPRPEPGDIKPCRLQR